MGRGFRSVPLKIWLVSIVVWTFASVFESYGGRHFEVIWFLNLIIVIMFTYYKGISGGVKVTLVLLFMQLFQELAQTYPEPFEQKQVVVLLATTAISLLVAVSVGLVVDRLHQTKRAVEEIFDNTALAIWSLERETGAINLSRGIERLIGVPSSEQVGVKRLLQCVHPDDMPLIQKARTTIYRGEPSTEEFRIIRSDGQETWVESHITPVLEKDSHHIVRFTGVIKDITNKKKAEDAIKEMVYHDVLTGLPNRYLFNEMLREKGRELDVDAQQFAILTIDLDRFKEVNDTYGHDVGDVLLIKAAERIRRCMENHDHLFRLGSDEFISLLCCRTKDQTETIARCILEQLARAFSIKGQEIYITVSIGASIHQKGEADAEHLLKQADTALSIAKQQGKNRYQFYSDDLNDEFVKKIRLEQDMRKACGNHEFELYYQPQVNLLTGEIAGLEALLRWNHPELGLVSPGDFIPIAEDSGLIIPLGEWVLRTAATQNKQWQEQGYPKIPVAVNVSGIQFMQTNFVKMVQQVLEETGLAPQYLELEITESIMLDIKQSITILQELKALGIRVAIDDFGTGYSSLNVLKSLTMDSIKIDRSFIEEVRTNANSESILKMIIELSKQLHSSVIAEGIEEKEQISLLTYHDCFIGQGFYFSKPLPSAQIEPLLSLRKFESGKERED